MKKIILLFAIFCSVIANAQVEKMEPPFWWANMNNTNLQLMIYGENIADYQVSIADENVNISNIRKTENPNYVFVMLDFSDATIGSFNIDFLKKGKVKFTESYELKERRENAAIRKSFDSSDLMYLIMPDRFANGNSENDSTDDTAEKANRSHKDGRHGGDIQGVIDHLDYLDDLGVTALWSTPLLEDNEPTYSYHTYAQSDFYKIDSRYGTNDDYRRLADEMHKRDMKLVMDYVTNHWGSKHWMIQDLPTNDWIHQWDNFQRSNYRMETQFDTNASDWDSKYCMDGWFDTTMPDMNQSNELYLNYIIQNAIWWIEFADLDGFRVDTYSYNDKEGIAKWTKAITDEYPYFNIVGEVWMHNQAQIAYWQKDSKIAAIQSYNTYLPSVMDFTLHDAIGSVFHESNPSWNDGMIKVYQNFVNDFLYPDINNILVFAENHDTSRINHVYPNIEEYKMTMALIATVRGIPQIYYGSEIGMTGDKGSLGDGDIRRDFPGGWEGDATNAFEASERTDKQKQYFDFTSKLFQWRKNKEVIHTGKFKQFLPQNNVYVYFRYNDSETVMVIINNSTNTQTINLSRFSESINAFPKGKDVISESVISLDDTLIIDGKKVLILELSK